MPEVDLIDAYHTRPSPKDQANYDRLRVEIALGPPEADARFSLVDDGPTDLPQSWLGSARSTQWECGSIARRRGRLEPRKGL